jgi:hypothetical protein
LWSEQEKQDLEGFKEAAKAQLAATILAASSAREAAAALHEPGAASRALPAPKAPVKGVKGVTVRVKRVATAAPAPCLEAEESAKRSKLKEQDAAKEKGTELGLQGLLGGYSSSSDENT